MANVLTDLADQVRQFIQKNPSPASFVSNAQPVKDASSFISKFPRPLDYVNSLIPGGFSGGAQRVQQTLQNPTQLNLYAQMGAGNLPAPEPIKQAGQFVGNYVNNRYVQPLVNLPKNLLDLTRIDQPLISANRGMAGLGTLAGLATLIPDPIQDVGLPAYDYLKGVKASSLQGGSPLQNIQAGLKSASLEHPTGLGQAITNDPTGQLVLNLAELPLTILMTHQIGRGQKLGFSKNVVNTARKSFSPEVRNVIGKFAQTVETNPNANRANLGQLGDYVQTVAESLWGDKAANLTNKQLKNAFDILMYQVDKGTPVTRFTIGLNASDIRKSMEGSKNLLSKVDEAANSAFMDAYKEVAAILDAPVEDNPFKGKALGEAYKEVFRSISGASIPFEDSADIMQSVLAKLKKLGYTQADLDQLVGSMKYKIFTPQEGVRIFNEQQNPPPAPSELPDTSGLTPKERLKSLLTYDSDMRKLGYKANQIPDVITSRKIMEGELPGRWNRNQEEIDSAVLRGVGNETNGNIIDRLFYPIRTQSKKVQTAVTDYDRMMKVSEIDANAVNKQFKTNLPPELEWRAVMYSQDPTSDTARRLGLTQNDLRMIEPILEKNREYNDALFREARQAGIEVDYRQHHIYQLFQGDAAQVDEAMTKGLGKTPGFAKRRKIPTFEEGMKYGLTPRYTTFGAFNASARQALDKALINKDLVDKLLNSKELLPVSQAPDFWQPIRAKFFPKARIRVGIDVNRDELYAAPPQLATFLDNLFGTGEKPPASQGLEVLGSLSQWVQDKKMTGGIGTINGFTIAQTIKDITAGLGDIATLHPVRGVKTMAAPLQGLMNYFIPGASKAFEETHAQSIREMAKNRIGYAGLENFRNSANVADKSFGSVLRKANTLWDSLSNTPTFASFMQQRKVLLYEAFRDTLTGSGLPADEAARTAAEQLKNYDGIVDAIGRSKDIDNGLKAFLFAPKYREATIGSLTNVVKGLLNPKNADYAISRRLGLGLLLTYYLYNQFNKKQTGRPMWENAPGHEFDLAIPKAEKKGEYWYIPFGPSLLTLPRRVLGAGSALIQGDTKEAGRQLSGIPSSFIQTLGEMASGKDYYGRDIFDPNENLMFQQLSYAIKSNLPGPMREGLQYYQDQQKGKNPSAFVAAMRSLELPIKEGKDSAWFYSIRDDILKNAPADVQAVYNQLHTPSDEGVSKIDSMDSAISRLANFDVVQVEGAIDMATAQKLGRLPNPFYQLSPEQQKILLWTKALPPGNAERSKLYKDNLSWLEPYWQQEADYWASIPRLSSNGYSAPLPTSYVKSQMDRKNWKDTQVQDYLNTKRAYDNELRVSMGLPELPAYAPFSRRHYMPNFKKLPTTSRSITNIQPAKLPPLKISLPKIKKTVVAKTVKTPVKKLAAVKTKKLKGIKTSNNIFATKPTFLG